MFGFETPLNNGTSKLWPPTLSYISNLIPGGCLALFRRIQSLACDMLDSTVPLHSYVPPEIMAIELATFLPVSAFVVTVNPSRSTVGTSSRFGPGSRYISDMIPSPRASCPAPLHCSLQSTFDCWQLLAFPSASSISYVTGLVPAYICSTPDLGCASLCGICRFFCLRSTQSSQSLRHSPTCRAARLSFGGELRLRNPETSRVGKAHYPVAKIHYPVTKVHFPVTKLMMMSLRSMLMKDLRHPEMISLFRVRAE